MASQYGYVLDELRQMVNDSNKVSITRRFEGVSITTRGYWGDVPEYKYQLFLAIKNATNNTQRDAARRKDLLDRVATSLGKLNFKNQNMVLEWLQVHMPHLLHHDGAYRRQFVLDTIKKELGIERLPAVTTPLSAGATSPHNWDVVTFLVQLRDKMRS